MMRPAPVLAVTLLLLLPAVGGEEVRKQLFDDDTGDVEISTQDGTVSQRDPTGFYRNVDVALAGVWSEDDDSITFYLEVDDLTESSQVPLPFSDPDYELYFSYREQGYRATVVTALENAFNGAINRQPGAFAFLEREVGFGRFQRWADAEAELDYSEERVLITVPRVALVDQNQAPLARNSTLHDIYVASRSMGWFGFPLFFGGGGQNTQVGIPKAHDRAPDSGSGTYVIQTGTVEQRGSIFAVSPDPVRWTNGEATTLTFPVMLTNLGKDDVAVRGKVENAGPGWEVSYTDALKVPAGRSINTTLLASIPFSHQHGMTHLFRVVYESSDAKHRATASLGVHWPAVPQPAGHHDRLWLHSMQASDVPAPFNAFFSGVHGWFSASEELEEDSGVPIPAAFTTFPGFFGSQEGTATWYLPLEPALRMGLDFDPSRTGTMEVGMMLPVPAVDPYVEVELIHQVPRQGGNNGPGGGGNSGREVLVSGTSEVQSGTVSGGRDFDIELSVSDVIKTVPYQQGANLYLQVTLHATFLFGGVFLNVDGVTPTLDPTTSTMQLPLNEYHDPTNLAFRTDTSLHIQATGKGQERLINPGRTILYTFELHLNATAPATFDASISGRNVAWGRIVGDQRFDIQPGASRTLALAVTAPEDARDGEQADITLKLVHSKNAAIQAGVGTLTTVTTTHDVPDESDELAALEGRLTTKKDTPAVPLVWLAMALVALGRRRR